MDVHGNPPSGLRKEISCTDCGHVYFIGTGQQSSLCSRCGNVSFHSAEKEGLKYPFSKNVLPMVQPRPAGQALPAETAAGHLTAFETPADGHRVQELLMKYQVEWQLWAKLTQKFGDPDLHAAYISHIAATRQFEAATKRYSEHRSVMVLLRDSFWQAEVAELMLSRVEALAGLRMEMEGRTSLRLPERLSLLPLDSRVFRVGWIALGLIATAKLFGIV